MSHSVPLGNCNIGHILMAGLVPPDNLDARLSIDEVVALEIVLRHATALGAGVVDNPLCVLASLAWVRGTF